MIYASRPWQIHELGDEVQYRVDQRGSYFTILPQSHVVLEENQYGAEGTSDNKALCMNNTTLECLLR